jgi:hypothetical protein
MKAIALQADPRFTRTPSWRFDPTHGGFLLINYRPVGFWVSDTVTVEVAFSKLGSYGQTTGPKLGDMFVEYKLRFSGSDGMDKDADRLVSTQAYLAAINNATELLDFLNEKVEAQTQILDLMDLVLQIDLDRTSLLDNPETPIFVKLADDFVIYENKIFDNEVSAAAHLNAARPGITYQVREATLGEQTYWSFRYHNGRASILSIAESSPGSM